MTSIGGCQNNYTAFILCLFVWFFGYFDYFFNLISYLKLSSSTARRFPETYLTNAEGRSPCPSKYTEHINYYIKDSEKQGMRFGASRFLCRDKGIYARGLETIS